MTYQTKMKMKRKLNKDKQKRCIICKTIITRKPEWNDWLWEHNIKYCSIKCKKKNLKKLKFQKPTKLTTKKKLKVKCFKCKKEFTTYNPRRIYCDKHTKNKKNKIKNKNG